MSDVKSLFLPLTSRAETPPPTGPPLISALGVSVGEAWS